MFSLRSLAFCLTALALAWSCGVRAQSQTRAADAPMQLQGLDASAGMPEITQDQLLQKMAGNGYAKADIQVRFNNLRINGKTWRDADGDIARFAFDALTGDITYLVKRPGQWWVKYINPARGISPLVLARITGQDKMYTYEDVLKHQIKASQIVLAPKGLLLQSGRELILVKHANEPQTLNLPPHWQLAPYQRGNSVSTRTVLLEQTHLTEATSLALYNLDTDQLLALSVQTCAQASSDTCDPLQNYRQVHWFQSASGPMAVVQQPQHVLLIDLTSGYQINLMPEQASLELVECEQTAQGGVSLRVKNADREWRIDDATTLLAQQGQVGAQ